jgi:hypothetical protein
VEGSAQDLQNMKHSTQDSVARTKNLVFGLSIGTQQNHSKNQVIELKYPVLGNKL